MNRFFVWSPNYNTQMEISYIPNPGKAALCPVLKHDYITFARTEFRMKFSTPSSSSEILGLV
jgi:hypothetical protein